jgi:hypothetical protein
MRRFILEILWKKMFSFFKDKTGPDYTPKAMDFTSVTMNREMQVIRINRYVDFFLIEFVLLGIIRSFSSECA